jgi:hypothetical protein
LPFFLLAPSRGSWHVIQFSQTLEVQSGRSLTRKDRLHPYDDHLCGHEIIRITKTDDRLNVTKDRENDYGSA